MVERREHGVDHFSDRANYPRPDRVTRRIRSQGAGVHVSVVAMMGISNALGWIVWRAYPPALMGTATVAYSQKRYTEAQQYLDRTLALQPIYPGAAAMRARSYAEALKQRNGWRLPRSRLQTLKALGLGPGASPEVNVTRIKINAITNEKIRGTP